jgi:pilus assembly protein CpaE
VTIQITAVVALEDGVQASAVDEALPAAEDIRVVGYVEGLESGRELNDSGADLVIVACSTSSQDAIALIEDAVRQRPERPIVVLQMTAAQTNGFMTDVFAAGADDIIDLPETPERIRHAIQKAIARRRGATLGKGRPLAPLVCVLGPKGGTGKTVTTCNLGVALADGGQNTSIVDLDLHFGDVGLGLRLTPERTIYDLARSGGTLDAEKLEDYLAPHASGVRTLLAPTRPDHAGSIETSFIAEVLALLRAMSDVVIVDTPAGFPPEVITAIDSSTDACVVGMLDAFSLKDTKLGLETLDLMGYKRASTRIVLNRADSHVGIRSDDVKAILGREPDILVPSERDIVSSLTEGIPIVTSQPRSPAAKSFRALAAMYAPAGQPAAVHEEPQSRTRRSLLRRS